MKKIVIVILHTEWTNCSLVPLQRVSRQWLSKGRWKWKKLHYSCKVKWNLCQFHILNMRSAVSLARLMHDGKCTIMMKPSSLPSRCSQSPYSLSKQLWATRSRCIPVPEKEHDGKSIILISRILQSTKERKLTLNNSNAKKESDTYLRETQIMDNEGISRKKIT